VCGVKDAERLHGQLFDRIVPYPVYFDIEKCEGCSFYWICQYAENNRKAIDELKKTLEGLK
jgi:hypothetical protein